METVKVTCPFNQSGMCPLDQYHATPRAHFQLYDHPYDPNRTKLDGFDEHNAWYKELNHPEFPAGMKFEEDEERQPADTGTVWQWESKKTGAQWTNYSPEDIRTINASRSNPVYLRCGYFVDVERMIQYKSNRLFRRRIRRIEVPASKSMNPVARTILCGVYGKKSPLRKLVGHSYILKKIWRLVTQVFECPGVKLQHILSSVGTRIHKHLPFALINVVAFPQPSGININMMPIVAEDPTSVPKEYHSYLPLIQACRLSTNKTLFDRRPRKGERRVVYLTIQESYVPAGKSQRRGGIHTDRPGEFRSREITDGKYGKLNLFRPARGSRWGCGMFRGQSERFEGGIYMASTVSDTCRVWPAKILSPDGIIGPHGQADHLRPLIGEPTQLQKNMLYWITDTTPHESLPMPKGGYRQFFRLVDGGLSAWYSHHSTANPLGVKPDAKVIEGSKFI
mmetsp:Transcript_28022/g.68111  ORF Transcript_28022/g.68111 Transcript_28022/m.68111 type:complete len:451 (-) Transcript_28022:120-1472(-)